MAPASDTKPSTDAEWKAQLHDKGQGRALMRNIYLWFDLDLNKVKRIKKAIRDRIESINGFPALLLRCRTTKQGKGLHDQQNSNNKTHEVEKWLATESEWAHLFGDGNTTVPLNNRLEAVRKLVFDAKQNVSHDLAKEEQEIDDELSPTKKPSSRALTPSPHPLKSPNLYAARAWPQLTSGRDSATTSDMQPQVSEDHRLLREYISNILQFNVRLLSSLTSKTITRLPFRYLIDDHDKLKRTEGGFTGDDMSMTGLVEFVQQNVPLDTVRRWKEQGHNMQLTHSADMSLDDQDDFAVAVNHFINGPRAHTDLCITLQLGSSDVDMTGK